MKKFIYIAAAALAAAACAQNEVTEVTPSEETPICFETAPITKGHTEFDHKYVFQSAAWYLEPVTAPAAEAKTWEKNFAEGVKYIPESTVSYMTSVWRTEKNYYWPKNGGTLSFYSWSLNKEDLKFANTATTVTIDQEKGVVVNNYDVTVEKNTDFIVADPALDKKVNEHKYYTDGVPTLFRHKLSKMSVTAQTKEDYTKDGKTITIKNIKVTNVVKEADFQECEKNSTSNLWTVIDQWTSSEDKYDATYSSTDTEVTNTQVTIGGEQTVYIPQDFTGDEILEITYEVYDEYSKVKETITFKIPLKDALQSSSSAKDGKFEPGKQYTINLTFTLDLVYWDPAVEDWEVNNKPVTVGE